MLSREERMHHIVAEMRYRNLYGPGRGIYISEVGRLVGLRVTPYLRGLLGELCHTSVVQRVQVNLPTGSWGWVYYLPGD